ncbi:MAG: PKD domain-containing protein, partial [Brumimicrobium sp.]
IWDSASNGYCADTICQTVTITNSTCNYDASFTYSATSGNTFSFSANTYDPNLYYTWYLSDNTSHQGPNLNYTFNSTGTYDVCLNVWDIAGNCSDTICQTVVVDSTSGCNADVTINYTSTPGEVEIIDNSTTSSGSNATYSWVEIYQNSPWNHEATINLQPNSNTATYQFTDNGTYTYYYTVQDSITNCMDTLIGSITINNIGGNCNANFSYYDTLNNQIDFYIDDYYDSSLYYSWDFGDGNYSNDPYPSHIYDSTGIYNVCLTVWDNSGNSNCADTICQTVVIDSTGGSASLNNTEALENEVSLYPNPASSTINLKVESGKGSQVEYKVLDVTGKIVINSSMTISSGVNDEKINVDHIRQGVYFIQITSLTTGERLEILKFVKK